MNTDLRALFGRFPTGVAVVSTLTSDRTPLGVTISSFNSVSLAPQMAVFSLTRSLHSTPGFAQNMDYGLSFLAEGQEDLAMKFARSGADKWADVALLEKAGDGAAPLLAGATGYLALRRHQLIEAGDHLMFLCEITRFCMGVAARPLVFCQGKFQQLAA